MRAIIEKKYRRGPGRDTSSEYAESGREMMSGGIPGGLGLRFHNAAAEAARGEIADDIFPMRKRAA